MVRRNRREGQDSAPGRQRQARAIKLLVSLAARPELPEIDSGELGSRNWTVSKQWAGLLVAMAKPVSAPLAELLGRSWPPDHEALRGLPSRSERLCELLADVDRAALELSRRIDKAEAASKSRRPRPAPNDPDSRAEAARAELRALGIEVTTP